jgi:hypothetical protein
MGVEVDKLKATLDESLGQDEAAQLSEMPCRRAEAQIKGMRARR